MTLQEWADAALAHQFGQYIDVDGAYQGQCWDLSAHKARNVDGCPTFPTGSGGAEGVYRLFLNPLPKFYDKVENNHNDVNQLPPIGAHLVYGPTTGNQWGHIEVNMGATNIGADVIYQDGFNQTQGPLRKFRKWGALPLLGWLIPKASQIARESWQRIVSDGDVKRRPQPNTQQKEIEIFKAGEVLDFAGWIYGETVENNNIWFKGRYSDTYFWSGAFTNSHKEGLTDLNPIAPPPVTNPNLRTVIDGGLNVRSEPTTLGIIIKTLPQGTGVTILAYRQGAIVDGNNIWFRIGDGWVWSGGLDNQNRDGLTDETPIIDPTQPIPDPTYPKPTNDPLVTVVFNKKHPIGSDYAPTDLISVGNGQSLRKEAADAFNLMVKAAVSDGIALVPGSGYRSYATQATVYDNYVKTDGQEKADTYSARPGFSEHQTGLTMDLAPIDDSFAGTPADKWLESHAHLYGFIMRYPKGFEEITGYQYEPWHYRYIGVDVAKDFHDKGKRTLEEYYDIPGGLYPEQEPTPDPIITDPTVPTPPTKPVIKLADLKAIMVNVIVTFVQAAVAVWALTGYQLDKGAIGGAVGAGLSVVWNTIIKPYLLAKGILKK